MTPGLHWNLDLYVDAIRLWARAASGKLLGSTTFCFLRRSDDPTGAAGARVDAQTCGLSPVVGNILPESADSALRYVRRGLCAQSSAVCLLRAHCGFLGPLARLVVGQCLRAVNVAERRMVRCHVFPAGWLDAEALADDRDER